MMKLLAKLYDSEDLCVADTKCSYFHRIKLSSILKLLTHTVLQRVCDRVSKNF
jgi:hypothetical protein